MKWLAIGFGLMGGWLHAEITVRGVVNNGTTGGDGTADRVQLIRLGQGMQVVGSLDNVTGPFAIEYDGTFEEGSFLIQAIKGRAIYSERIGGLQDAVEVTVYDASQDLPIDARISSLVVYAFEQSVDIGFFIELDNRSDPPRTLENETATFSFDLIPGYETVEASTKYGEMPLRQSLRIDQNRASINYPLKPGRTQLMVRNTFPYQPEQRNAFVLPLLDGQQTMHVLAVPITVEMEGEGLSFVSSDDPNDIRLYEWARVEGQTELRFTLTGESAAKRGETASASDEGGGSQAGHNDIQRRPNILHPYRWYIVGSILLWLGAVSAWRVRTV